MQKVWLNRDIRVKSLPEREREIEKGRKCYRKPRRMRACWAVIISSRATNGVAKVASGNQLKLPGGEFVGSMGTLASGERMVRKMWCLSYLLYLSIYLKVHKFIMCTNWALGKTVLRRGKVQKNSTFALLQFH